MKFTCERCGKKYATAEDPAPGRVYKLRCKACGHLIVVKASAAPASEHSPSTPPGPPSIGLEIGTPEPARVPATPGPNAFEATTDVSTAQMRSQHDLELTPRKGDSAYVDLFSDVVTSDAPQKGEDPFLAAARNSLPEGYGGAGSNAPDPFAGLREDISATSAPSEPPLRSQPAVPKVPLIPKPKQVKSAVPLVLIGAGVAVMVGILAFVLLSSGKQEPPRASPRPVIATPAPAVPTPTPPPVAAPPPDTAPVTPATTQAPPPPPTDDTEKRTRAEQKRREREEAAARAEQARAEKDRKDRDARAERDARDREAKAQARAEKEARDRGTREARDREKAERDARAKADREAKAQRDREARAERERAAAEAKERDRAARQAAAAESAAAESEGGLTQAQIESVLRSTKSAFDGCIQAARAKETLDGRRVMLRLNIQTTGAVTYPTLDDVELNGTDLGTCLKGAARLMVFPKFKGDTMHVEVPLVMR